MFETVEQTGAESMLPFGTDRYEARAKDGGNPTRAAAVPRQPFRRLNSNHGSKELGQRAGIESREEKGKGSEERLAEVEGRRRQRGRRRRHALPVREKDPGGS